MAWLRLFVNRFPLTCTFGLSIIICTNSVNQILLIYVSGFCIIICKKGMLIDWFPGHRNVWVDAIRVKSRLPPPFLIKNWSLKWGKKLSAWHISSIGGKKKNIKNSIFLLLHLGRLEIVTNKRTANRNLLKKYFFFFFFPIDNILMKLVIVLFFWEIAVGDGIDLLLYCVCLLWMRVFLLELYRFVFYHN